MSNSNFFAMLSRMKYINRWGLMRNTINENLSEHSLETAFVAHALAVIKNTRFGGNVNPERVALLAMYHDVTEILTGDLPTPIKYFNPEIKESYGQVEKIAKEKMLNYLPEDIREVYEPLLAKTEEESELWTLVKAADKISAVIKCVEEKRMGNSDFNEALESSLKSLNNMNLPEVEVFVNEFLPGYSLSLDEQTK